MIKIPYGTQYIEFDDAAAGAAVLCSSVGKLRSDEKGYDIVNRAMSAPIDSPELSELAVGKRNCVIIISDHTRPVPSRDILPNMFRQLREGNPGIEITLLVATGFHRQTNRAELLNKLGEEILDNVKVAVHDCRDKDNNVEIGILPSGAPCVIDKLAAEADLLIAEGFIEPHFFAGFSGGRKSVLPGICDSVTVLGNHCSKFIDSPFARTGILEGNPIHKDMVAAAKMAKLAYIVNVVIDEEKKTVAAFAGNFESAHQKGCDFLSGYCRVEPNFADIVITSNGGAPLDQNLYQCVKGMTAAEATCVENGTIIMCADCADGHGGEGFYRALCDCKDPAELYERQMATAQNETVPDQWESQILARILMHHRVIIVSRPEMRNIIESMKMEYAPTLEEALSIAGADEAASITVIPNGVSVIVASS